MELSTILPKKSILDIWLGSECTSEQYGIYLGTALQFFLFFETKTYCIFLLFKLPFKIMQVESNANFNGRTCILIVSLYLYHCQMIYRFLKVA